MSFQSTDNPSMQPQTSRPERNDGMTAAAQAYFLATHVDGQWRTRGIPQHLSGHPVAIPGRSYPVGVFARWSWDGQRLRVENDRYGMQPLFWYADSKRICVSSSLESVIRNCELDRLDFRALGLFLRLGHFVGDDTPFEGVKVLAPGSTLLWVAGQLTLESRGPHMPAPANRRWSLDDACEQYGLLFAQAISRRAPADDNFVVPISGGRDSRHILLELHRQGYEPRRTLTVKYRPPARSDDLQIGEMLSHRVGATRRVLDPPTSLVEAALQDIRSCHHCSSGHIWATPLLAAVDPGRSVIYDGLAGDVLSAGLLQDVSKARMFEEADLRPLAVRLLSEANREEAINACLGRNWLTKMDLEAAVERLTGELEIHRSQSDPLRSYVFWNRTRRLISLIPFGLLKDALTVHTPYLDHDLFDFLCTLPLDLVADNRLHDATIRHCYPGFSDIQFENKKSLNQSSDSSNQSEAIKYYSQSRIELTSYLLRHIVDLWGIAKPERILARIMRDHAKKVANEPWYLYILIQMIELRRLTRNL